MPVMRLGDRVVVQFGRGSCGTGALAGVLSSNPPQPGAAVPHECSAQTKLHHYRRPEGFAAASNF
jgi:hypothetical protein